MTKSKGIDILNKAIEHWNYNETLICLSSENTALTIHMLPLMKYLYTQAFIHGYKHGKENKE